MWHIRKMRGLVRVIPAELRLCRGAWGQSCDPDKKSRFLSWKRDLVTGLCLICGCSGFLSDEVPGGVAPLTPQVTELSLVGSAHPTADQGFRPFARIDFTLIQCHSPLPRRSLNSDWWAQPYGRLSVLVICVGCLAHCSDVLPRADQGFCCSILSRRGFSLSPSAWGACAQNGAHHPPFRTHSCRDQT